MVIVKLRSLQSQILRKLAWVGLTGAGLFISMTLSSGSVQAAACTVPSPDMGIATNTINVPATGTYRVWSRLLVPDTTNNKYSLEIDGSTCVSVGGSSSIPANAWTWVNYQDGNTATITNLALTAGSHTIKMIGQAANVELDRLIFTTDTACTPTGTGDNCATVPDTTPPTASVTSPTSGSTVSGVVAISANASDNVGVTKVEFYVDGNLVSTDTTSINTYTYNWDSTMVADGSHTITVKAYDAANNIGTSAAVTVTVSNTVSSGGITVDKMVVTHQTTAATSIASPSFSTTQAGDVVYAFINSSGPGTAGSQTISSVSGGGLTWTLRKRTNAQPGDAEIWQATAAGTLSNVTITATRSSGPYDGSMTVVAFKGASSSMGGATGSANAATGAQTASLTTTAAGSWVWGTATDWNSATARTTGSSQTKVDEYLTTAGDTYWVQRQNVVTATSSTSVAIDDTAPTNAQWNMSTVEILPAGAVTDTTPPTTSITAPANGSTVSGTTTVNSTASDNVGVTKVELWVDGSVVATDTASPYSFSWNTSTLTNATHTLQTKAYDAAGNVGSSAMVMVTVNNATPPPVPGDVNGDGHVTIADLSILASNYGKSGMTRAQGDLNGDGVVNILDLSILATNWGK